MHWPLARTVSLEASKVFDTNVSYINVRVPGRKEDNRLDGIVYKVIVFALVQFTVLIYKSRLSIRERGLNLSAEMRICRTAKWTCVYACTHVYTHTQNIYATSKTGIHPRSTSPQSPWRMLLDTLCHCPLRGRAFCSPRFSLWSSLPRDLFASSCNQSRSKGTFICL